MKQFHRFAIKRTTLITYGLAALLVGLFSTYYNAQPSFFWLSVMVFLIPFLFKKKLASLGAVILIGCMIGIWRGSLAYEDLKKYDRTYGIKSVFYGTVSDDPGYNEQYNQTQFHLHKINSNNETLPGRVQVSTREETTLSRGDYIKLTGKLMPSKGTSRQGTIGNAKVTVLSHNKNWIEDLRNNFFNSVSESLNEPQASLGLGYIVGVKVNIPKELSDQLAVVGLSHIVAVSGYNLTIIVQAVRNLIGRKSAYQSVVFSGLLIGIFIVITGSSAPITRAAVVCGFSLLAWYFGRTIKPTLLLLMSGAVTAFANPLYIWGDPGWYLSFLAFGGVLILAPRFINRFFMSKPPGTLTQILIETMGAQICTIPYTLYLFGGVSVIAPIANIAVLPLVPFIMLAIFITGLVGMILPAVAAMFGIIPSALLSLQVWVIQSLSQIPHAHVQTEIDLILMVILYGLIILFIGMLPRATKNRKPSEK